MAVLIYIDDMEGIQSTFARMIFITGATGLLGSKLLFDLLSKGFRVRAMVRGGIPSWKVLGHYFNSDTFGPDQLEWVSGDLNDKSTLIDLLKGVSIVYHCAGKVSFIPDDQKLLQQVNVIGTANIVDACLINGVSVLCHVSSVSALGRSPNGIYDERTVWSPSESHSQYAISKYAAEREVWRGMAEGLNALVVNPGIILGPGNWESDSSALFARVYNGLRFYTNGANGFVSVDDVSHAMMSLVEKKIFGERFVLVGANMPYKVVMEQIAEVLRVPKPNIHAGPLLSNIAWRWEALSSHLSGKRPLITRETARSAQTISHYSSDKIQEILPGIFSEPIAIIKSTGWRFLQQINQSDT
jgi:nucleoside-diphosphate-sugar epimerase